GVYPETICSPRNQAPHRSRGREWGFVPFRGNKRVWSPRARSGPEQPPFVPPCRLADSYLPIGGPHDHEPALVDGMVDIPASRFLRPVGRSAVLERLRLQRITSAMETAARRRKLFHLWWHPPNFGADLQGKLGFLGAILDCFRALHERYGMGSMTMAALADDVLHAHGQSGGADG